MAGGSFYAFLCASVQSRWVKCVAVAALLLTGISRPYLGVHYVEDILLGWPDRNRAGGDCSASGPAMPLATGGSSYQPRNKALIVRIAQHDRRSRDRSSLFRLRARTAAAHRQLPRAPVGAFAVAHPLEIRWVQLRSTELDRSLLQARANFGLGVALVHGNSSRTGRPFFEDRDRTDPFWGTSLRYLALLDMAGFVGMLAAPYLYVRLGWADATPRGEAGHSADEPR